MAIEEQNILIRFISDSSQLKRDSKEMEKAVEGVQRAARRANKELGEAFKTNLASDLLKLIKQQGVDLEKLGGKFSDVKKGIEDAFNDLTPEEFAAAVENVNALLDDTESISLEIGNAEEAAFNKKAVDDFADSVQGVKEQIEGATDSAKDLEREFKKPIYSGDTLETPIDPDVFEELIKQQRRAAREQRELTSTVERGIPTYQEWKAEIEANRSVWERLRDTANTTIRSLSRGLSNVGAGVVQRLAGGVNTALNVVSGGIQRVFSFVSRLGGLVGILGIADLIAGWSTFSQQIRATLTSFPAVNRSVDRVTSSIRRLAQFVGERLAPIVVQIADYFERWVRSIDLSQLDAIFTGIGVVLSNLYNQIATAFGDGEQSLTNIFLGFAKSVVGVFNGVIQALDEFGRSARALALDTATGILRILESLPGQNQAIRALRIALDVQAEDARAGMGSIVEAFREGYNQITQITGDAPEWKDISPAPLPEEVEADKKRIQEEQDILLDWLQTLNEVAEEVLGFRTPFEAAIDRIGELRKEIESLQGEAKDLLEDGIITDADYRAALGLIEEFRRKAVQDLQRVLAGFELEPLEAPRLDNFEEVERIVQRQASNVELLAEKRAEALDQFLDRLALVREGIGLLGEASVSVIQAQRFAVQEQLRGLERLSEAQAQRVEQAILLADKGNAELLQLELERQQQIQEAKEQAVRRDRELAAIQIAIAQSVAVAEGIAAIIAGFKEGNLIKGIAQSVALIGTITAAIISIRGAFSNIQAFWQGEPFIEGQAGRDKIPALVTRGERVMTVDQNKKIGGKKVDNETLVQRALLGEKIERMGFGKFRSIAPPPPVDYSDFSIIADSIHTMQNAHGKKLENLSEQMFGVRQEIRNLKVIFQISEEGIEAGVRSVNNKRTFRNKLKR